MAVPLLLCLNVLVAPCYYALGVWSYQLSLCNFHAR